jgi:hypothetical protein
MKVKMQLTNIINEFSGGIEGKVLEMMEQIKTELDFIKIEEILGNLVKSLVAKILEWILNQVLREEQTLKGLKEVGGSKALKYKEYREISVRLGNGENIRVLSPYFVKTRPKRKWKKRGPNGSGSHVGLEVLGFVGRCSLNLVSNVVQAALLCPSFEVAESVLKRQGLKIDLKTIRRLCEELGEKGLKYRGKISLAPPDAERLKGQTLVIGIDGGRLRERINKGGNKKAGQKRQGFYTDWKEPKLFTIYLQNAKGEIVRQFAPLHDATMGNHEEMFVLLTQYLQALDLSGLERMVFCGDGAPWLWSGVEALIETLNLTIPIYQVLDYTHAKQNLAQISDLLPLEHRNDKKWQDLLWQGNIEALGREILQIFSGKNYAAALNKWCNYFVTNQKRMQYTYFKLINIPCGSGCVESAIRRVINLRLKSPGSFWKKSMAEFFLFLRSQLLSGRWDIFIINVSSLSRHLFPFHLFSFSNISFLSGLKAA